MNLRRIRALLFLTAATPCLSQPALKLPPGGTVTGHVLRGDTQLPARFAHVLLLSVAPASPQKEQHLGTNQINTLTSFDGSFTAAGILPGDYFAFAWQEGYYWPNALVDLGKPDAPTTLPPSVRIVHIAAQQLTRVDLTMPLGATVSGQVFWDDGSPVAGVEINLLPSKLPPNGHPPHLNNPFASVPKRTTDDLGHFRIPGQEPGEYLLSVNFTTRDSSSRQNGVSLNGNYHGYLDLTVFAPAAFHVSDAKPVILHASEELSGQTLTINLATLHSVSGQVLSSEDRHALNSGDLTLTDDADKTFSRRAVIDPDGTFTLLLVPPGSYSLKVEEAVDGELYMQKDSDGDEFVQERSIREYEDATIHIIVAGRDLTGTIIQTVPQAKKPDDPPKQ